MVTFQTQSEGQTESDRALTLMSPAAASHAYGGEHL